MRRPMDEMLRKAAARRSGHMPGHKGRAPFECEDLYALDTTELPVTDDLYAPERGIAQAEALYARAAGAGKTIFLHNGSTAGIHVMLQLWAREGETVILPRNAHLSAMNACAIGGMEPVWIPVTQRADGYCYVREEDVLATLRAYPEAKTLLMTRPDYYGGCTALENIIAEAHAMGVHVVVDEAHGAHLPWLAQVQSAGALGADAWVQSVHKTLPGLTGAAVLHLRDETEGAQALRILRREQTSSPSFLLMRSIDDARALMEMEGAERLKRLTDALEKLRLRLKTMAYRDAHALWRETGEQFDPTRLVLDAPEGGAALADALEARGLDVEMHDAHRVVLIFTCMDGEEDVNALEKALTELPKASKVAIPPMEKALTLPEKRMSPRRAVMAQEERVPLDRCEGRVAAVSAGLYPPGIPLVCPGEEITREAVAQLAARTEQQRFGMEGECMICVK